MSNPKLPGADPIFDEQVCVSLLNKDVVHFTRPYPDNHTFLCGNHGVTYDRTPQAEYTYTVCAKCLREARPLKEKT